MTPLSNPVKYPSKRIREIGKNGRPEKMGFPASRYAIIPRLDYKPGHLAPPF
jgi:hypothetical protein